MKKVIVGFLLIICVCVFAFGQTISEFEVEITGTGTDQNITIKRYTGIGKNIIVPSTINGIPVIKIAGFAFNESDCTTISIPDSVVEIERTFTFIRCKNLASITVDGANVQFKSIDGVLFSKDGSRILRYPPAKSGTTYTIPDGVKTMDLGVFEDAEKLTTVVIPVGVSEIPQNSFRHCTNLTNITIPEGVTTFDYHSFDSCGFVSITIPKSVTKVWNAFYGCDKFSPDVRAEIINRFGRAVFTYDD
jgi:hypothetical protein